MSSHRASPAPSSSPSSAGTSESRPDTPPQDGHATSVDRICAHVSAFRLDGDAQCSAVQRRSTSDGVLFNREPLCHRQLLTGKWKNLCNCPKGIDRNEWIAVHIHDFTRYLSLVHEIVITSGTCTSATCPTMRIAPDGDCPWQDQKSRPAPLFFDAVLSWINNLCSDTSIFPTQPGRQFHSAFLSIARRIWACLADLWSHMYYAHYQLFVDLSLEAYVNSLAAHFAIFGLSNDVVGKQAPMFDTAHYKGYVFGRLVRTWSTLQIVPRDLRM